MSEIEYSSVLNLLPPDFHALTKRQSELYTSQFILQVPTRISELKKHIEQTETDLVWTPDGSMSSLAVLEEWLLLFANDDDVKAQVEISKDRLGVHHTPSGLIMSVCIDAMIYVCMCMQTEFRELSYRPFRLDRRDYRYNQPGIWRINPVYAVCPFQVGSVFACKVATQEYFKGHLEKMARHWLSNFYAEKTV